MTLWPTTLTMSKLSKAKEKESAELTSQDNWEPGQTEKHT